jgi:hypothetical protein
MLSATYQDTDNYILSTHSFWKCCPLLENYEDILLSIHAISIFHTNNEIDIDTIPN